MISSGITPVTAPLACHLTRPYLLVHGPHVCMSPAAARAVAAQLPALALQQMLRTPQYAASLLTAYIPLAYEPAALSGKCTPHSSAHTSLTVVCVPSIRSDDRASGWAWDCSALICLFASCSCCSVFVACSSSLRHFSCTVAWTHSSTARSNTSSCSMQTPFCCSGVPEVLASHCDLLPDHS
jgi:hypothetical protein